MKLIIIDPEKGVRKWEQLFIAKEHISLHPATIEISLEEAKNQSTKVCVYITLSIYWKELKDSASYYKDNYSLVLISALFIIVRN